MCVVVLFAISLQCTVLSSLLSKLHEIEHAAGLVDTHSFNQGHHHVGSGGHHHPGVHHLADNSGPDVGGMGWLLLDGHSHGVDTSHVSGEHGFFHFSGGLSLFDQGEDLFGASEKLPTELPLVPSHLGLPRVHSGAPHRPPIA